MNVKWIRKGFKKVEISNFPRKWKKIKYFFLKLDHFLSTF